MYRDIQQVTIPRRLGCATTLKVTVNTLGWAFKKGLLSGNDLQVEQKHAWS